MSISQKDDGRSKNLVGSIIEEGFASIRTKNWGEEGVTMASLATMFPPALSGKHGFIQFHAFVQNMLLSYVHCTH